MRYYDHYQNAVATGMWNMHSEGICFGGGCPIHHPSRHNLATRPLKPFSLRGSDGIGVVVYRECVHRFWHVDPDCLEFLYKQRGESLAAEYISKTGCATDCCDCCGLGKYLEEAPIL